eukprot:scaffold77003_cov33-Tisochrysis_lutea.AAC.8
MLEGSPLPACEEENRHRHGRNCELGNYWIRKRSRPWPVTGSWHVRPVAGEASLFRPPPRHRLRKGTVNARLCDLQLFARPVRAARSRGDSASRRS